MSFAFFSQADLGFSPFFQQQLTMDELEHCQPARLIDVQGGQMLLWEQAGVSRVAIPGKWRQGPADQRPVIGDWLLMDAEKRPIRLLARLSYLARRASGHGHDTQGMAANINTLFVVSSCNRDFNASRLERYLILANEGGCQPVILLTKADLIPNADDFRRQAERLQRGLVVLTLDARKANTQSLLEPWLSSGQTIAFLGSSGVGKSTLINTLLGEERYATQSTRTQDDRGLHTTTARSMVPMPGGTWLIDTPGMRELRLGESSQAMENVFADIELLARGCQYRDCRHDGDGGCAVMAAVTAGNLDNRRLVNYLKLQREQAHLQESQWQQRDRQRRFSRMVNQVMNTKLGRR
ncbi:MAG: ribosome small subunit-dependent GTPase A [Magnetococcales bacterium]|nr:ribosome small subunit-dependent GTPase A [Magnetococcales bacterium]